MAVNISDDRLVQIQNEENKATTEINKTYNDMIDKSQGYYDAQIEASKEWADKQSELQQEKTDFAIEQIEQQKAQAEKDYTKEQSGAYVDWQKQSNAYGVNAEQMAMNGFTNSGYSESSLVSMYNTYQNRVATAKESYNQIVMNYNNSIKEAQLQNNSTLAQIAYESLQAQLELSLQGFQYQNQLVLDKLNAKRETQQIYHNQYMDMLGQINTEKALAEEIRQYNASLEEEKRQYNSSLALQKEQLAFEKEQANKTATISKSSSGSSGSKSSGGSVGGGLKSAYDIDKDTTKYEVNTAYYQGAKNKDCKNGTFSNGYQPDNINGKKLTKTGEKITLETVTLSGQKQTVVQNVWKTPEGLLYYWDGRYNKYIGIKQ